MVADSRDRMSMFVSGVLKDIFKECRTSMLIKKINHSRFRVYALLIEEEKMKDKERENKRARTSSFNISQ